MHVDSSTRLDATYELDADWRLLGGLIRSAHSNSQQFAQEPDYNFTAADAGVRYVLARFRLHQ